MNQATPKDAAIRARELKLMGYTNQQISVWIDRPSSTVSEILRGEKKTFCDKLTTRQIQNYLNGWR